jgi:hypothetical protein
MRAGNGKGLQPSTRELFSRPQEMDLVSYTTRIHTNRGHSGLGPNKCQSLETGRSGVLRACVPLPWSQPFPWSRPPPFPCSHVPTHSTTFDSRPGHSRIGLLFDSRFGLDMSECPPTMARASAWASVACGGARTAQSPVRAVVHILCPITKAGVEIADLV